MFFRSLNINKKGKRGFTLIELAIVLAVTSLLTVGLWRMMASGNTQLRDQAAADQHKELIASVRAYLATSDGQAFLPPNGAAAKNRSFVCLASDTFCNFLSNGFDATTTNSYGQTYAIQVKRDSDESYSFMIKTIDGDIIPDTSGGRISSLIGADGGFVYTADICTNPTTRACGAFGSWSSLPVGNYGFPTVGGGQIASRTFIGGTAELNTPWLARVNIPGDTDPVTNGIGEFNTIQTDISLAGNSLFGIGDGSVYGGSIEGFRTLTAGRTTVNDGSILDISAPCSVVNTGVLVQDASCDLAADITGDVSIVGKLNVTEIFGAKYIYTSSDRRLKKDLKPLDGMLEKLSHVKAYHFTRIDTGEKQYGVIAQEVEKVFPDNVHPIDNNYKGVDYMGFIGPLISAVNELRIENKVLRSELNEIKKSLLIK